MNKMISVLTPAYNAGKYIAHSIESVLNQTYADFELIIVDDGSSDNTPDIIRRYKDPRIRLFRNERNIGQTKTLNKAIGFAEGELIARMDTDDISFKNRFEKQVKFLSEHEDIVGIGSSGVVIDNSGKKLGLRPSPTDTEEIKLELLFINPILHSSIIFRKDVLKDIGHYDEEFLLGQDYELWSRMVLSGYRITNIKEPLIFLRIHSDSLTHRLRRDRFNVEASRIIKRNVSSLTGVDISLEDSEKICDCFYDPAALSDVDFECADSAVDRILKGFNDVQPRKTEDLGKIMSKFNHIIATGYVKRGNLARARSKFFESLKTNPYNASALLYCIGTLFGRNTLRWLRGVFGKEL
ncbi:MAG: glycosyltransferase [Candidatus Omnitrophota bacterium]